MSLRPTKIVCVGRNYADHARELGNEVPANPLLFLKPPSALIGPEEPILLPDASERVEHEAEIGVVIGERCRDLAPEDALRVVSGVRALNDVTARDLQKGDGQWTRAKGFDTFCPVGPVAALPADLSMLTVVCRVNGEERQRGSVREMVFGIAALISHVSRIMTWEPGDILATGTPAGVGPLRPGDVVEVEIPGVSSVRNPVHRRNDRQT